MLLPEINPSQIEIDESLGVCCCSSIDFPIWVLVKEGILIPPFDQHEPKDSILASLGFDADGWYNWVKRIVLPQESRRYIKFVDVEATIAENISKIQQYIPNVYAVHDVPIPDVDWESLRVALRHKLEYENRLYQQYVSDCNGIEINNVTSILQSPHLLWLGDTTIKEYLSQLWNEYSNSDRSYRFLDESINDPKLFFDNFNNPRFKPICCKQYWLVYPYPVQYAITRESVIIGVPSSEAMDKNKIAQYYTQAIELVHNLSIKNLL